MGIQSSIRRPPGRRVTTISARCPAGNSPGWLRPLHRTPLSNPPPRLTWCGPCASASSGSSSARWAFTASGSSGHRARRASRPRRLRQTSRFRSARIACTDLWRHGPRGSGPVQRTVRRQVRSTLLAAPAFRLGIPAVFILLARPVSVPRRSPNRTMVADGATTFAIHSVAFRS
jgi:hypothetical protein